MTALRRQAMTVELADGRVIELQAINPDYLRVERKLPTIGMSNDPNVAGNLTYLTALAWAALCRMKEYSGELVPFLNEDCVVLDVHRDDSDDADDDDAPFGVDPTQPAADTGSP